VDSTTKNHAVVPIDIEGRIYINGRVVMGDYAYEGQFFMEKRREEEPAGGMITVSPPDGIVARVG